MPAPRASAGSAARVTSARVRDSPKRRLWIRLVRRLILDNISASPIACGLVRDWDELPSRDTIQSSSTARAGQWNSGRGSCSKNPVPAPAGPATWARRRLPSGTASRQPRWPGNSGATLPIARTSSPALANMHAVAAVHPAAIDDQRRGAVGHLCPLTERRSSVRPGCVRQAVAARGDRRRSCSGQGHWSSLVSGLAEYSLRGCTSSSRQSSAIFNSGVCVGCRS